MHSVVKDALDAALELADTQVRTAKNPGAKARARECMAKVKAALKELEGVA
jgi:hypothetical protein